MNIRALPFVVGVVGPIIDTVFEFMDQRVVTNMIFEVLHPLGVGSDFDAVAAWSIRLQVKGLTPEGEVVDVEEASVDTAHDFLCEDARVDRVEADHVSISEM